ncbi:MAG: PaaI family thioesterase [Desulfobacterales bacterium]
MPKVNPAYVTKLFELVNTSPFPNHLCMRITDMDLDRATITMDLQPEHLQLYGIVHGGALATLIDTATFWAVFMRLPDGAGLVNIDLKLNYLKSVRGGLLTTQGRCLRAGRSISYAEADVRDADGNLLAHGTSTLKALPGKGLDLELPKFI